MALIDCTECGKQVSSTAAACPGCGAPITEIRHVAAAGAPVATTQTTSKKLKKELLYSGFAILVGVIWMLFGGESSTWAILLTVGGVIWAIRTKVRIWWHHG